MDFEEKLKAGQFVITAEIAPPKGVNIASTLERVDYYRGVVDAVNVTDQQASVMRASAISLAHVLLERGFEPICQLTCRDRNIIAIQSDLLGAHIAGIKNILCLTGDRVNVGDHPNAKAVFDLDAVSLLKTAKTLQEGKDAAGHPLEGAPTFFLGAAATSAPSSLETEIMRMKDKVEAGAQFFQTQPVFDTEEFARFSRAAKGLQTPIITGIILIKSARMARNMNARIPGIHVPEEIILDLEKAGEQAEKLSIEIAARTIREVKAFCQGVHLMPLGWEEKVPALLEASGLLNIGK